MIRTASPPFEPVGLIGVRSGGCEGQNMPDYLLPAPNFKGSAFYAELSS